jgi:hypothetical protein
LLIILYNKYSILQYALLNNSITQKENMSKYEIDLLIAGSLEESEAKKVAAPLISIIDKQKEYTVDE